MWPAETVAPTEILDILITRELQRNAGGTALQTSTRDILLVHDDSVGQSSGKEGRTVGEHGPAGVVVEGDVGEEVAQHGEEQGHVAIEFVSLSVTDLSSAIEAQKSRMMRFLRVPARSDPSGGPKEL